jgi:hypothetical protein
VLRRPVEITVRSGHPPRWAVTSACDPEPTLPQTAVLPFRPSGASGGVAPCGAKARVQRFDGSQHGNAQAVLALRPAGPFPRLSGEFQSGRVFISLLKRRRADLAGQHGRRSDAYQSSGIFTVRHAPRPLGLASATTEPPSCLARTTMSFMPRPLDDLAGSKSSGSPGP